MAYDQQRHRALVQSAAVNYEFWRGTIQDQSSRGLAMSFVGAPTFGRVNGHPCLKQNAAGDCVTSGAVPMAVDVLGDFFLEVTFCVSTGGLKANLLTQGGVGGGFTTYWVSATQQVLLYLFTAAGAAAGQIYTPVGSILPSRRYHLLMQSLAAGTNGRVTINGVHVAPVLMLAGVAAAGVNSVIITAGHSNAGCRENISTSRLWRGQYTNEDATCLAAAAESLVGGW